MTELIEVKAARPHKTGYAQTHKVQAGDSYTVPASALPELVRQKLIERPKGYLLPEESKDAPAAAPAASPVSKD